MMMQRFIGVTIVSLSLVACAATNTIESTDPITTPDGLVSPQKNLIVSDMSYGSAGNGRAKDEVFNIPVTTFRVAPTTNGNTDPNNGAPLGLVRDSATREDFGAGNTMTYFSDTNTFVFDIQTEAGTFQRSFNRLLQEDPVDFAGVENSAIAKLYGSKPESFSSIYAAFGRTPPDPNTPITTLAGELTALAESDLEADNNLYTAISDAFNTLVSFDQYIYSYSFAGGVGYYEATNTNGDRRTDNVAIGSFVEYYDNGEELHGHTVFGSRTPFPEMPQTGKANFEGKIVGSVLTNNSIQSLTGSSFVDVDFATGLIDMELSTIIRVGGGQDGGTTFIPYKNFTGTAIVNETVFDGTLDEVAGDSFGEFEGGFFGPIANEVGGTFTFGDGSSYGTGAFTGQQVEEGGN
ncbi:MAG: transferrin-binding protein-like solute binding protein [Pseudomonadota bacterium]